MIAGLDKFLRDLKDAKKAFEGLEGELGTVSYDPRSAGGIEAAISEMERFVDERVGSFASNPIVAPMVAQLKEHHRQALIDQAAAARLKGDQS